MTQVKETILIDQCNYFEYFSDMNQNFKSNT